MIATKNYRGIINRLTAANITPSDLAGLPRTLTTTSGIAQLLKDSGIIRRVKTGKPRPGGRYVWDAGPMYTAFLEAWRKYDGN